jgi:hypothetical protein
MSPFLLKMFFRSKFRNFASSAQFFLEISKLKKSELFLRKNEILGKSEIILRKRDSKLENSAALIKVLNQNFDLTHEKIYNTVLEVMINGWHSPASAHFLDILKKGNPFFKAWYARFSKSFDSNGIRLFDPKILPEFGIKFARVYIQLMHCAASVNKDFDKVDQIFQIYIKACPPDERVYAKYLSLISLEYKDVLRIIKPKVHSVIKNFKSQIPVSDWKSSTVVSVMKSILNICDFNSAISFYHELNQDQKVLEVYVFLITYLVRFKYLNDAEMIVNDLIASGLELSVMARISLLDFYARARKVTEYKILDKEMSELNDIQERDWSRIWEIQVRAISLWDSVDALHAGKKIITLLNNIEKKKGVYNEFFLSTAVECLVSLVLKFL